MYGDDTDSYSSNTDPLVANDSVPKALDTVIIWCEFNTSTINESKTKITTCNYDIQPDFIALYHGVRLIQREHTVTILRNYIANPPLMRNACR